MRDPLGRQGFALYSKGNEDDQLIRIAKGSTAEVIMRVQKTGRTSRISIVSSKFTGPDSSHKANLLAQLWTIIDSLASQRSMNIPTSVTPQGDSLEQLLQSSLRTKGFTDIAQLQKFARESGNDPQVVTIVAERISDGKQFTLTEDKTQIYTRDKVKEMILSSIQLQDVSSLSNIPPKTPSQVLSQVTCPSCGRNVSAKAMFCQYCGYKLNSKAS